ncbi:hypothetical protein P692DRAFT_20816407 [Suillus brevipes Sb2]|nr:hypothetical protein P692DRAFT_20816407 [Suillus brevipes Sb2]
MASLMGRVAEDLDHNDESVRKIFSRGLQRMSAEGIRRAAYYKEAELEYHRHLSMTLAWEAEKLSRLKHFLDEEQQLQADKTTEAFEEAALFTRMIVDRDSERASEDLDSVTATHKDEMKKMNELNTELDELDIFLSPNLPAPHNAASDIHINTKDEPAGKLQCSFTDVLSTFDYILCCLRLTTMPSNTSSRRRVVRDVPIVRQTGLNIAGHSSADQLGCASETPDSMGTPPLPPRINPPPVFSNDGYSSMPPNHQGGVPLPRPSHFTGEPPRATGPDRVHRSFAPSGDIGSRYRMVYAYAPLRGAERSRQEYTDGVVYRDQTTGIQKSVTRRYPLPPVRPPRESLAADSDTTPTVTTPNASTSSTIATRTSHQQHEPSSDVITKPVVSKTQLKVVVKEAKDYVVSATLNKCGFRDSTGRMDVVHEALTEACSFVIDNDRGIRLWIDDNVNALYKSVVTPMSTILNRFKKCAQDLVENVYGLDTSIWTDETVRANHNKTTVDFLTGQGSLNFIFGDIIRLENGREIRYPFEHKAIIQIAVRAAFRDGYHKFIDSDESLDNIMSMSAAAACCSLQEFATGVFKQIDFTYTSFHALYTRLMDFIRSNIRNNPNLLNRWRAMYQNLLSGAR